MKTKTMAKIASLTSAFVILLVGAAALASNQSQLNQAINAGAKSVDIVDGSGNAVASPAVSFSSANYSFDTQDTTGTLGTASEKIRAYNPTSVQTLTVSIAASNPTDTWISGGDSYDFNDPNGYTDGADADNFGGQMTINPSDGGAVLAGVSGCATSNVSKGSSASFSETGTVKNSIDLITSTSNAANKFCRWDLTGVSLTQKIPAAQAAGSYTLNLVLTIS
jgi:hypothetical protein